LQLNGRVSVPEHYLCEIILRIIYDLLFIMNVSIFSVNLLHLFVKCSFCILVLTLSFVSCSSEGGINFPEEKIAAIAEPHSAIYELFSLLNDSTIVRKLASENFMRLIND